jgi:D-hexose-6-phosphate mutarotase
VIIQDPDWGRRIRVDGGDNPNTVVWHPGTRPIGDVSWAEGLGFVAVEAAALGGDSLTLAPGEDACLRLRASVE